MRRVIATMKNHPNNPFRGIVAFCAGCLLSFMASVTVSGQTPPVGNWDCVLSGDEKGVAQLFFYADYTLEGRALYTYTGKTTGTFTDNKGITYTNIFGGAALHGQWSYTSPKRTDRIVGFINGVSIQAGTGLRVTNSLSFEGSASTSKLNLTAIGYAGRVTFRCIPLLPVADLTGAYNATGRKQEAPAPFAEIFSLTRVPAVEVVTSTVTVPYDCSTTNYDFRVTTNICLGAESYCFSTNVTITHQQCVRTETTTETRTNSFAENFYHLDGAGPGYEYLGQFLVSRQNRAAFYQARRTNDLITVYTGEFNPDTGRGSLLGTDGKSLNIKFDISHGP